MATTNELCLISLPNFEWDMHEKIVSYCMYFLAIASIAFGVIPSSFATAWRRLLSLNMWARSLAGINFANVNANVAVPFKYAPPFALTPDKQSETKTLTFVQLKA